MVIKILESIVTSIQIIFLVVVVLVIVEIYRKYSSVSDCVTTYMCPRSWFNSSVKFIASMFVICIVFIILTYNLGKAAAKGIITDLLSMFNIRSPFAEKSSVSEQQIQENFNSVKKINDLANTFSRQMRQLLDTSNNLIANLDSLSNYERSRSDPRSMDRLRVQINVDQVVHQLHHQAFRCVLKSDSSKSNTEKGFVFSDSVQLLLDGGTPETLTLPDVTYCQNDPFKRKFKSSERKFNSSTSRAMSCILKKVVRHLDSLNRDFNVLGFTNEMRTFLEKEMSFTSPGLVGSLMVETKNLDQMSMKLTTGFVKDYPDSAESKKLTDLHQESSRFISIGHELFRNYTHNNYRLYSLYSALKKEAIRRYIDPVRIRALSLYPDPFDCSTDHTSEVCGVRCNFIKYNAPTEGPVLDPFVFNADYKCQTGTWSKYYQEMKGVLNSTYTFQT